jgi:3-hydroxyacyl-CoA dehydrogenase
MLRTAELMIEHGLGPDEVDSLTGPFLGRARSATFRTADLVGLDVLLHVADNVSRGASDDPEPEVFTPPAALERMVQEGKLGEKTGEGFFKKVKEDGTSTILALDLESFEYRERRKARFPELEPLRSVEDLDDRLRGVFTARGEGAWFCWEVLRDTLRYAAAVAEQIAHDLPSIDAALRWGFGWQKGPFEVWDALGLGAVVQRMDEDGRPAPAWVCELAASGAEGFYRRTVAGHEVARLGGGGFEPLAERAGVLDLRLPSSGIGRIEGNAGGTLWDLGDGVLGLEFHSKMNTIGGDILSLTARAVELAERDFRGVVVGNQGPNFSVGANLALLLMAALEGEWEEIDLIVRQFQRATTGLRRCVRPVVIAPFGLTLGGGCEYTLHGDTVHASAELYTGLVEGGVGLVPAGGGTKELYLRMLERLGPAADPAEAARAAFETIGMAKVSTSAEEARRLGFLRPGDSVAVNPDRLLAGAKAEALALADTGYRSRPPREDVPVSGEDGRALLEVGLYNMLQGGWISEHDRHIGRKLSWILTGGDVRPGATVTEQHLLDLEREAFLSLCGERKTLERIQHMLKKGKPLRN